MNKQAETKVRQLGAQSWIATSRQTLFVNEAKHAVKEAQKNLDEKTAALTEAEKTYAEQLDETADLILLVGYDKITTIPQLKKILGVDDYYHDRGNETVHDLLRILKIKQTETDTEKSHE